MCKEDKKNCGCQENSGDCGCDNKHESEGCGCGGDHGDGCGCGHDHGHGHQTVTLLLDDDTELTCPVLDLFEINEQEYIALFHPVDETALLYRFHEHEDGGIEIESLSSDEEFDLVSKTFLALQEED